MPLLDPKFLAAKQGLVTALDAMNGAAAPLVKAADESLLEDPGDRLGECDELVTGELAKLRANRFRIGIFGLVKAGKSTLINALAEEYLSEVDSLPATTAALHLVKRTGKPLVHYLPASGKIEKEIDKAEAVKLLDEKGNPNNVEQVDFVDYPVDLKYLEDDVVLVDTPGLGYILRAISDRAGRELHESVHAVVLVVRVFGGQLWQREIREFLNQAVQRCPRVFVVVNCDERKSDEWGDEAFNRISERFTNELKEAGRVLRTALEDGTITVHFVSALEGAAALLRLRSQTSGTDTSKLQSELEHSRFLEFRKALAAFAAGDKRLWDDLRFRGRGLVERVGAIREAVRSQVQVHLRSDIEKTSEQEKKLSLQLAQLQQSIQEAKAGVALESEDLIGELIDKAQVKADEFLEDTVHPAVERWLGTSDTPAALETELQRMTEAWRPQLQEYMDKRLSAFSKRLGLKIRSELFHRLNTAVEVNTDVPLDFKGFAKLPPYDFAEDLERGLSNFLIYALAALVAVILWSTGLGEGEGVAGRLLAAVVGFVGVLALGKFVLRNLLRHAFATFLRGRAVPAMVKGFFHEAAIRKLGDTKQRMRREIRDAFTRKRDEIVAKIGGEIGKALDEQQNRLRTAWGAERDKLVKRLADQKVLLEKIDGFTKAADDLVRAARAAAE